MDAIVSQKFLNGSDLHSKKIQLQSIFLGESLFCQVFSSRFLEGRF